MKCLIFFVIIIIFLPLINADSTFFDNPDDSFVMGSSEQASGDGSVGSGDSKKESSTGTPDFDKEDIPTPDFDKKNDTKEGDYLGEETKDYSPDKIISNWNYVLFFVIIILFCTVCIGIFKYKKNIRNLINGLYRKYNDNSIKWLINKKVYTDDGYFVGKIKEAILDRSKIHSLKVRLNKRHKLIAKGVIIKHKDVKAVGNIVIVDDAILSHLRKYKN